MVIRKKSGAQVNENTLNVFFMNIQKLFQYQVISNIIIYYMYIYNLTMEYVKLLCNNYYNMRLQGLNIDCF